MMLAAHTLGVCCKSSLRETQVSSPETLFHNHFYGINNNNNNSNLFSPLFLYVIFYNFTGLQY